MHESTDKASSNNADSPTISDKESDPSAHLNPFSRYEETVEIYGLTLYDIYRSPRTLSSTTCYSQQNSTPPHISASAIQSLEASAEVKVHDTESDVNTDVLIIRINKENKKKLHSYFRCPICLGYLKKTFIVMECLHRFCGECIQKCLRVGIKKECPSCRIHIPSRRSLRPDTLFDSFLHYVMVGNYGAAAATNAASFHNDDDDDVDDDEDNDDDEHTDNNPVNDSNRLIPQRKADILDLDSLEKMEEAKIEFWNKELNMNNADIQKRRMGILQQNVYRKKMWRNASSLVPDTNNEHDTTSYSPTQSSSLIRPFQEQEQQSETSSYDQDRPRTSSNNHKKRRHDNITTSTNNNNNTKNDFDEINVTTKLYNRQPPSPLINFILRRHPHETRVPRLRREYIRTNENISIHHLKKFLSCKLLKDVVMTVSDGVNERFSCNDFWIMMNIDGDDDESQQVMLSDDINLKDIRRDMLGYYYDGEKDETSGADTDIDTTFGKIIILYYKIGTM